MNKHLNWKQLMSCIAIFTLVSCMIAPPDTVQAVGGSSGGSSSSSSSSSASSSAASSGARSSTTSSSNSASMARQSAINASRQSAQQASRSAAMRASQTSRASARNQSKFQRMASRTRSLTPPTRRFSSSGSYQNQFIGSTFYNNWLFYYLILNMDNSRKKSDSASLEAQKRMLKQQMKHGETLYTITLKTKNGKRLITLPKKDYDKVKKGSKITYHNGKITVEDK